MSGQKENRYFGDSLFLVILGFMFAACLGCGSVKTSDDFINDYCKCLRAAKSEADYHKCQSDIIFQMAEQMKTMHSDEATRKRGEAIIYETSNKLSEARKKCGDTTFNAH